MEVDDWIVLEDEANPIFEIPLFRTGILGNQRQDICVVGAQSANQLII